MQVEKVYMGSSVSGEDLCVAFGDRTPRSTHELHLQPELFCNLVCLHANTPWTRVLRLASVLHEIH